jgi:protein SCO1
MKMAELLQAAVQPGADRETTSRIRGMFVSLFRGSFNRTTRLTNPCKTWHLLAKTCFLLAGLSVNSAALAIDTNAIAHNPLFDMVLIDQNAQPLPLAKFKNKTVLLNFIYTECLSSCPLQTRQIAEVQKKIPAAMRKTIRFLSVSVDPAHDSPAKLKAYAKKMGAKLQDWTFATGSEKQITELTGMLRALNPGQTNPQPSEHSSLLYLYNKQGLLVQRYSSDPVDVARLAREIQQLDQLVK